MTLPPPTPSSGRETGSWPELQMALAAVCPSPASTAALGLLPESLSVLSEPWSVSRYSTLGGRPQGERGQGHTMDT